MKILRLEINTGIVYKKLTIYTTPTTTQTVAMTSVNAGKFHCHLLFYLHGPQYPVSLSLPHTQTLPYKTLSYICIECENESVDVDDKNIQCALL